MRHYEWSQAKNGLASLSAARSVCSSLALPLSGTVEMQVLLCHFSQTSDP
jgi:hypothetical protein